MVNQILFSNNLIDKSAAHKIAYIAVAVALCIITNMFELKFATVQFSFTIVSSILACILIGPVLGFAAVFLGDGLGYLVNSAGYPYYWWVALACATMALVAGIISKLPLKFRGQVYVKLSIITVLTFVLCSVVINSCGMYFIGLKLYMPPSVLSAFNDKFGGEQTFGLYLIIRFFILGQIWNSVVNYFVLFIIVPALKAAKPLNFVI